MSRMWGTFLVVVGMTMVLVAGLGSADTAKGVVPLADALDNTTLSWTNPDPGVAWFGQTAVSHDGEDAGQSGAITHNGSSGFSTLITGPGVLSFWWKVSSEAGHDPLGCSIDGVLQQKISGQVEFIPKTLVIPSGSHLVKWKYWKDGAGTAGQDAGWVDQVTYVQTVPLPEALDNATLVWTNPNPGAPWFGQTAVTHDGVDASQSGLIADTGQSGFSTQITGPGILSFWWKVSSEASHDYLGWSVDGVLRKKISGEAAWTQETLTVAPGSHLVKWKYWKDAGGTVGEDAGWVDQVHYVRTVPLCEALDNCRLVWTNPNPGMGWFGQMEESYDGVDAGHSGLITHYGQSGFSTQIAGPGVLSFWWKVSSEAGHDFLGCSVDGVLQQKISGESTWTEKTLTIPSGTHLVKWKYWKDGSGTAGQDTGWVDQVVWESSAPKLEITTTTPPPAVIDIPYTYTLSAIGGAPPYTYEVMTSDDVPDQFATSLPPNLELDSATGEITGTPSTGGIRAVLIQVTDSFGSQAVAALGFCTVKSLMYVSASSGSDTTGNGSLAAPFATVARAIYMASGTRVNPIAILIEKGTYPGALLEDSYEHLFGGYSDSTFAVRDSSLYDTIIDGQAATNKAAITMYDTCMVDGISVTGGYTYGITSDPIELVIVANCRVFGNGQYYVYGSGIYFSRGNPLLINDSVFNNRELSSYSTHSGAGLGAYNAGVAVVGCCFWANSIESGGLKHGAAISLSGAPAIAPYIGHNIVASNILSGYGWVYGGGIDCRVSVTTIENNMIVGNRLTGTSGGGGGGICTQANNVTIRNNVVWGNDGYQVGGGIYVSGSASIVNNTIASNIIPLPSGLGGGIYWASGATTIANNLFFDNTDYDIAEGTTGGPWVINNDLSGTPDGLYWNDNSSWITDIAVLNALPEADANISADPLIVPVVTGAFTGTTFDAATGMSTVSGSAVEFVPGAYRGLILNPNTRQYICFYIVDNDASNFTVLGDLGTTATAGDTFAVYDFHLDASSPCVDAGSNTYAPSTDIDLDPRPQGPNADIGADEVISEGP